jgi:hypothetical protein
MRCPSNSRRKFCDYAATNNSQFLLNSRPARDNRWILRQNLDDAQVNHGIPQDCEEDLRVKYLNFIPVAIFIQAVSQYYSECWLCLNSKFRNQVWCCLSTNYVGESSKGCHNFFYFLSHFPPSIPFLYLFVLKKEQIFFDLERIFRKFYELQFQRK